MSKITVELEAFYGYSCGFQGRGSNETVEIEVNEQELEALRKLGTGTISCEDIVAAIESGDTTLKSLHEKLEEKFYYMVEEYWLYEADNECIDESLRESFNADVKSGIYPPVSFEDFIEWCETGDIDSSKKLSFLGDLEDMYLDGDEEDLREKYDEYIYSKYYEWVCEHDHEFVAERVGLNLDACRDYEVNYTIQQ